MKNKKGITIGRVLLYILFVVVFLSIIWVLVLTYRVIAKNPNKTTNIECDFSLRYQYSSQYDYSATSFFDNYYMNFYTSSDIVASITNNSFAINNVDDLTTTYDNSYQSVQTLFFNAIEGRSYVPYSTMYGYTDNEFNLLTPSKSFYDMAANHSSYEFNNGDIDEINWFEDYSSACIVINCSIPYSIFNFTTSGANISSAFTFYILGDRSSNVYQCDCSNFTFSSSSIPAAFTSQGNSVIKKIVLPMWQSSNANGSTGYVPAGAWSFDYTGILNYYPVMLFTFDIYTESSDWQNGYNEGYQDGLRNADAALSEYNQVLESNNASLNYHLEQANLRISTQAAIIDNLQNQLNNTQLGFKNFFFTMADVPFKTVSNVLGFEVFGLNLFQFFTGILTALGCIWLIKKFL